VKELRAWFVGEGESCFVVQDLEGFDILGFIHDSMSILLWKLNYHSNMLGCIVNDSLKGGIVVWHEWLLSW
jgi:hypothetical protein